MTSTLAQRRKDMLKHEKGEKKFSKKPHLKETIVNVGDGKREKRLVAVAKPKSKSHRTQNGIDKNKHQNLELNRAKSELTLVVRKLKRRVDEKILPNLERIEEELKRATTKKGVDKVVRKIIEIKIEQDRETIKTLKAGLRVLEKWEK